MNEPSLPVQGWRFALVGAGNTVLTYFLFLGLLRWLDPQPALALVYVVGIVIAYVGNSRWVFASTMDWRSALAYPAVYLFVYAMTALGLDLFITHFNWPAWLAMAACVSYSVPLSFILNRALFASIRSSRE